jgi:hypothetical protein
VGNGGAWEQLLASSSGYLSPGWPHTALGDKREDEHLIERLSEGPLSTIIPVTSELD